LFCPINMEKFTPEKAMTAQRGGRCIGILFP
jgi:hypothetical protein